MKESLDLLGSNPVAGAIFAALIGLVVGSFANVCVHRLPHGMSLWSPASHCPACGCHLRWHQNIPLLSFALLGGDCAYCATPIPSRYPAVEALMGALFFALYRKVGMGMEWTLLAAFAAALVIVAFIDLQHRIIPDSVTLPLLGLGLIASAALLPHGFLSSLYGLLIGGGFLFAVAVAYPGGMGAGDIKMAAMMGSFLGWKATLVALVAALICGSAVGAGLLLSGRKGRRDPVPFGPFLSFGALFGLFFADQAIAWYLEWAAPALY